MWTIQLDQKLQKFTALRVQLTTNHVAVPVRLPHRLLDLLCLAHQVIKHMTVMK